MGFEVPTVRLKHLKTGDVIIVNEIDYAMDIGSWQRQGYARVGETALSGDAPNITTKEEVPFVPPRKGDEVYAVLKGGTKVHLVKVVSVNKKEETFVGEVESGTEKNFGFDQIVPAPAVESEGSEGTEG